MVICRIYCGTPPESYDKCDLKVQLIRAHHGLSKRVMMKMFPSCGSSSLHNEAGISSRIILLPDRFVMDRQSPKPVLNKAVYTVYSPDNLAIVTGEIDVPLDGLVSFIIPPIVNEGYYTLSISYNDGLTSSICMLKLFVC